MKKLLCALLSLLLAALPALAEAPRVEYADQGGVRVFVEDGLAGLMDADGNVLLDAAYDCIEPFAGMDFTVMRRGDKQGVVRRDGRVAIPCEYEWIYLYPGMRLAVCDDAVFDLDTGGVWMTLGNHQEIDVDERYAYVLTFGEEGFGYDPPFYSEVYDRDRRLAFSANAWFVRGFEPDYAILAFDDGVYGAMDAAGNIVAGGLYSPPWTDGQDYAYDDAPRAGALHVVREVKNPLDDWLKPLRLDRSCVRRYIKKLGFNLDGRWTEALMEFYEDGSMCGVVEPDGTTRFEMPGAGIYGPDEAGLYRVQTSGYAGLARDQDLWVYIHQDGSPAIDAEYTDAYPFVDGAAVVCERGAYHLIDVSGRPVGDFTWTWEPDMWSTAVLTLPVIPIDNPDGDGYRVIDRRGEYVTDEVFSDATDVLGDNLLLFDEAGSVCLMDGSGNVTLRAPSDDAVWSGMDHEAIGVLQGGKWGVLAVVGDRAGEWLVPPEYAEVEWLEGGGFRLRLNEVEDDAVYADRDGHILGPAPAYELYVDF